MARILYAEDDESLRSVSTFLLERRGYQVDSVVSGDELLSQLEAAPYDLIISDNDMSPGMSGLAALRRIRADERYKELPFILFSANEEAGKSAQELGAVYLDKDGSTSAILYATIEKLTVR